MSNAYLIDGYPTGPGTGNSPINRRDGPFPTDVPSDWFTLCNLSSSSPGDSVFLFVDGSGSLGAYPGIASGSPQDGNHDIQPSYDKFITDCTTAGIFVYLVSNTIENYIDPFVNWVGVKIN